LVLSLLYVNALQKGIDSRKVICKIVEPILQPFEGFSLTFEGLLRLNRYAYLVVDHCMGI